MHFSIHLDFSMLLVKNSPANAGDIRDMGSIPGSRRSAGERNGDPLQYSCPENPMDRGAWQGHTGLKQLSAHTFYFYFTRR